MKPLDAAGASAGLDTMAEDLDQLKYKNTMRYILEEAGLVARVEEVKTCLHRFKHLLV